MSKPIIQSLWIGDKLSQVEKLCISSYIYHGHEFHLYCFNDIEGVPDGCIIKDASEILPREEVFTYNVGPGKGSSSAFSNYFRYKLLDLKGNWWTDEIKRGTRQGNSSSIRNRTSTVIYKRIDK